jgi:hypothetical protein
MDVIPTGDLLEGQCGSYISSMGHTIIEYLNVVEVAKQWSG